MKKYLLLLLSVATFAQTNPTSFNKIKVVENIKDNLATRVIVQDSITKELKWVLKSSIGKTNISIGNKTANTIQLVSSTGTGLVLPSVTTTEAGLATAADKLEIDKVVDKNPLISHLQFNNTDKTIWNNGKGGNIGNAIFGQEAFRVNTSGYSNAAFGFQSLDKNTTGNNNTAVGDGALANNTSGLNNVGVGFQAGRTTSVSSGQNNTSQKSTYIGSNTLAGADGNINETVIGSDAVGKGSNTVSIGSVSVTDTYLAGKVTAVAGTLPNHLVTKSQLDLKANIDSATLTGTPSAPTPTAGSAGTQIATKDYADSKISGSGTAGSIPVFTSSGAIGNSTLVQNGTASIKFGTDFTDNNRTIEIQANTDAVMQFRNINNFYAMGVGGGGGFAFRNGRNNSVVLSLLSDSNANAIVVRGKNTGNNIFLNTSNDGATMINTPTDDNINKLIVNGTATASPATLSNQLVTKSQLDLKANIDSPALTGTPTAPTPTAESAGSQIANKDYVLANSGSGSVVSVSGTSPIASSGGTSPIISISSAGASTNGALSSTDWNTFNNKQAALGFTPYNASNPSGYTANSTDAQLRDRATHTGTQLSSTISDLQSNITNNTTVAANTAKVTNATHTGEVTGSTALTIANNAVSNAKLSQVSTKTFKGRTTSGTGNIEDLTVSQVRSDLAIDQVNNTSDSNKPISTATNTALNGKISGIGTTDYIPKFTDIGTVGNSIIQAFSNNVTINGGSGAGTLTLKKSTGASLLIEGTTGTTQPIIFEATNTATPDLLIYTGGNVRAGILSNGNVGINQPTPTEKFDVVGNGKFSGNVSASPATVSTHLATLGQITKTQVGLSNVPNLSFSGSNTGDQDLSGKANLNSPALTGTPTAPTASNGTSTTQIATTAFVMNNSSASLPYKVYTALLSQSGTNAPVATVLQNTLGGTVVFSYVSEGQYVATLSSAFTSGKTITFSSVGANTGNSNASIKSFRGSVNTVDVLTVFNGSGLPSFSNDLLLDAAFEIRVYN